MQSSLNSAGSLLRSDAVQRVLALGALVIIVIFFALASPFFLTTNNVINIVLATSVVGILAIGVTFPIITAGIDLSVGTNLSFSAVITAIVITNAGLPVPVGIVFGVLAGGTVGLINGTLIARVGLPPFIATLGMLNVARGLALVLSDVRPVYFPNNPEFAEFFRGSIIDSVTPGFDLPLPNIALVFFGAAILAGFILSKTVLGRYIFAIGSNEEATRLSGVRAMRYKAAAYVLSGLFAGLAGVMLAARLNSGQPAEGFGMELDAIAAAVIGGTSLSGGEGSIFGTVIGAFIISTLTNGLRLMSVPQEWQITITGIIVIFAVYLDILRRRQNA